MAGKKKVIKTFLTRKHYFFELDGGEFAKFDRKHSIATLLRSDPYFKELYNASISYNYECDLCGCPFESKFQDMKEPLICDVCVQFGKRNNNGGNNFYMPGDNMYMGVQYPGNYIRAEFGIGANPIYFGEPIPAVPAVPAARRIQAQFEDDNVIVEPLEIDFDIPNDPDNNV